MRTTGASMPAMAGMLLTVLALGVAAAQPPKGPGKDAKEDLLPGARLLAKFPLGFATQPVLVSTKEGPRLAVWVHQRDPHEPIDPAPTKKPKSGVRAKPNPVELIVWDAASGKEVHKFPSRRDAAPAFRSEEHLGQRDLSPDGRMFVDVYLVGGPGSGQHEAVLHELGDGKGVFTSRKKGFPHYVTFARDGSLALVVNRECLLLRPGEQKPSKTFQIVRYHLPGAPGDLMPADSVAVAPGGRRVAVAADGVVHVYDTATGKPIYQSPRAWTESGRMVVNLASVAFPDSPDDDRLLVVEDFRGRVVGLSAAPGSTTQVRLFDLARKKELLRKELAGPGRLGTVTSCDYARAYFTTKGEPRVFYVERRKDARTSRILCKLLDGASGKMLHEGDSRPGRYLLSPDGRYLARITARGSSKTAEVWSLENP
jgi:hypothetical protein